MESNLYACKNIFICNDLRMLRAGDLFDVGDIIRVLRIRAGIRGAKAIKQKLGINKATLSRIENTSRFDKETIERIAPKLGTSFVEILKVRDEIKRTGQLPILRSACPDNNPEHNSYHEMLERILNAPEKKWSFGIIANLEAIVDKADPREGPLPEIKRARDTDFLDVAPLNKRRNRRGSSN